MNINKERCQQLILKIKCIFLRKKSITANHPIHWLENINVRYAKIAVTYKSLKNDYFYSEPRYPLTHCIVHTRKIKATMGIPINHDGKRPQ